MEKILTIEQIQNMPIDEIINAYQNGFKLGETNFKTNFINRSEISTLQQHYDMYDIGIIAAAIGISVSLLGVLTYYIIKREEKKIVNEIKESFIGTVGRFGPSALEKVAEKLAPVAEKLGERLLAPSRE